jgi:hypothetical protein
MVGPLQYLSMYHSMFISDVPLLLLGYADIRRYISGEPGSGVEERGELLSAIAKARKDSSGSAVPSLFTLPAGLGIPASEEFCRHAIRRCYAGRGSPHEMIDTVRLAVAFGRVKHPISAGQYARKWFGSDCNAFVGNWLGVSPSLSVRSYFTGYGSGAIPGSVPSVEASRDCVPLKPIASVAAITQGTVVVTFGTPREDSDKMYKHIALVESIAPAANGKHRIELAEWGMPGGFDSHHHVIDAKIESTWRSPERKATPLLSFNDSDKEGATHRFFLDHRTLVHLPYRGWEVNKQWGV